MGIERINYSEDLALVIGELTALTNSFENCRETFDSTGLVKISTTFIQKIANIVGKVGVREGNELLTRSHKEVKKLGNNKKESEIFAVLLDGGRCQLLKNGKSEWKEAKMGGFCRYKRVIEDGEIKPEIENYQYIGRVDEKSDVFGERLYLEALMILSFVSGMKSLRNIFLLGISKLS